MFAKAGPSGEPIATPSICRRTLLLKLNSTEEVASCINSTKMLRGKDGAMGITFLAILFNRTLMGERMPEKWRRSVLIPIYKNKGAHSAVETTEE